MYPIKKVYYTREYGRQTSDVPGAVENILAVTNQGYRNSGVNIRLFRHCIEEYSGQEVHDGTKMLTDFTKSKGNIKDLLGSADLAMLLTSKSNVGGIAFINTKYWPVGMATKWGAESGVIFGHEARRAITSLTYFYNK